MGISFSCPGADYDSLNEDVEAVIVKSISFKGDGMKTMLRSVSFKGDDFEPTILKSIGSGKMIIEGSVSFKRKQITPTQLQTVPSITVISSNTKTDDGFNNKDNINTNVAFQGTNSLTETLNLSPSTVPEIPKHKAAVTLQKVYKSFRTRRQLADCAVLVEQKWWKLLDLVELKRTSVSFFDNSKTETAFSRWSRAKAKAAMVGKGLCKDDKAQKLALQHWLEAIDPRHRYGHNLDFYYNKWLQCDSKQPFFYWLDIGEGREINLECCSRVKLQQQCVKYLGPKEREAYEVVLQNGKFFHKCNGKLLDTNKGPKDAKWIFVLSTSRKLYIGEKIKGTFQHSSFLAGGSTSAAGRLVIEDGNLKAVWPHSGHYRPTEENFNEFISFLNENGVDLTNVKENPIDEDEEYRNKTRSSGRRGQSYGIELVKEIGLDYEVLNAELEPSSIQANRFKEKEQELIAERRELAQEIDNEGRSELPGIDNGENGYIFHEKNLEQDEEEVPQESIVRRLASRKAVKSYQLGKQLSFKWTTGAGPRIGCVRDYPSELQFRALEQVNLSPRRAGFTIGDYNRSNPMLSDTFIPTYPEAHGLCTNGI